MIVCVQNNVSWAVNMGRNQSMFEGPLMLWVNLPNVDTIHPQSRRVAEVFEGVFVLTGIFIKGGYQIRVPKARASWGVWGHAPSGSFEI